jgi:hypothetical protein
MRERIGTGDDVVPEDAGLPGVGPVSVASIRARSCVIAELPGHAGVSRQTARMRFGAAGNALKKPRH